MGQEEEPIRLRHRYVGHRTGEHLTHACSPTHAPSANTSPRRLTLFLMVNPERCLVEQCRVRVCVEGCALGCYD